jgi:protein CpxP
MNKIQQHLLIGLAVIGMAGTSLAARADEGRHGFAAAKEQMAAKRSAMFTEHLAKLHDKLKLTASQEAGWTTFVAAITPAAGSATLPDRAATAALSAPERMDAAIARAKARIVTMEAHDAALKTFYATLSADQKKVFDDNVMGGAHGPHPMMEAMQHHAG